MIFRKSLVTILFSPPLCAGGRPFFQQTLKWQLWHIKLAIVNFPKDWARGSAQEVVSDSVMILAMLHLETITCIKGRELNPPGLILVSLQLKVVLCQLWGTLAWRGHVAELRSIWFIMFTYRHLGGSGHASHTDSLLTGVPAPCFVQLVVKGKS